VIADLQLQRAPDGTSAAEPPDPASPVRPAGHDGGLPTYLKAGVEALSGFAMDDVRVHRNSAEPARLGALAYAQGSDIHLAAGQDANLPHEAWHVVQQKQGRVRPEMPLYLGGLNVDPRLEAEANEMGARAAAGGVVADGPAPRRAGRPSPATGPAVMQLRRLPSGPELDAAVPGDPAGLVNARTGMARLFARAWNDLSKAERDSVTASMKSSFPALKWTNAVDLQMKMLAASRAQIIALAAAITAARPSLKLGDPNLIDTGPRPGTSDAANIAKLATNALVTMTVIVWGFKDLDLEQVFGAANVATAKTKYNNARGQLIALANTNKIVTDRSGYLGEAFLGGLSNARQIALSPGSIDKPDDGESIVLAIHEALHAGNPGDVTDRGYRDSPSFTDLPVADKLTNSAHFEVVPRRMLKLAYSFPGKVFIPAGTTVGGVSAPALTPRQGAIREASELFRAAWQTAINLHKLFLRVLKAPGEWDTLDLKTSHGAPTGARFSNTLPYWSNVEQLTIHNRAGSNPAGLKPPVTQIDMALSEGLTRKLMFGKWKVPATPAAADSAEKAHASAAERARVASGSVSDEADLLVTIVLRSHIGSITGTAARDLRAIRRLALTSSIRGWSEYLKPRQPSDFK
jgi:Domain of unknown function (DUF4157)